MKILATVIITLTTSALLISSKFLGLVAAGIFVFAFITNKEFRGKF